MTSLPTESTWPVIFVFSLMVAAAFSPFALAHHRDQAGNMALANPGGALVEFLEPIDGIAPGLIPSGLVYYVVPAVVAGDSFSLSAGRTPQPIGPFVMPDFDVVFSSGSHENVPGNENGVIPGTGDAIIYLNMGMPQEFFLWQEEH